MMATSMRDRVDGLGWHAIPQIPDPGHPVVEDDAFYTEGRGESLVAQRPRGGAQSGAIKNRAQ